MNITLNVLPLPTCNDCGHPLKRAQSIREQLCCCSRGTCNTPVPFGCIVCGAFLIGRNDEVLGCCARCQVVTQTPVAAVSTPGAAATGQDLEAADPSTAHQERSDS